MVFADSTYSVKESDTILQVELLVINPASVDLTVQIINDDVSTIGRQ